MFDDKRNIARFEQNANDAETWKGSANGLFVSYNLLWNEYKVAISEMQSRKNGPVPINFNVLGPALILLAMGIESLLKSVWIKKGGRHAENGKLVKSLGSGHDLVNIANQIGVILTTDEKDILERLTLYIEFGRYPVGTCWQKGAFKKTKYGILPRLYWGQDDAVLTKKLVDRLRELSI